MPPISPNEIALNEIAGAIGFAPSGTDLQARVLSLAGKLGVGTALKSQRRILIDCRAAAGMPTIDLGGVNGYGVPDSGC